MQWSSSSPATANPVADSVPLFGIIIPGCPVSTDITTIGSGRWTAPLGFAPEQFVLFLTGSASLPSGYGVSIFIARDDTMVFQYIGCLTQPRPSTILTVPTLLLDSGRPIPVTLGLALELEGELVNLGITQEQPLQQTHAATKVAIAERILEDIYSFVVSYARSIHWSGAGSGLEDVEAGDYVVMPASFVEKWRARVLTKIQKDAAFWQ